MMVKSRRRSAATRRRTNLALLVLVPLAVLTGLVSNMIGTPQWLPPAAVHGVVALMIVLVAPWKAPIVRRGLGRRHRGRVLSTILLATIAVTVGSGLLHSAGIATRIGPLTVMQVHIGTALIALVLVVAHARTHRTPLKNVDLDRRAFLGTATLGAAGAASWLMWEGALRLVGARGAERRFTGSHERGSFDPAAMPVTSWLDDKVQRIDPADWSVVIDGVAHSLQDLELRPHEDVTAILDCTSGWYSQQKWSGVRLDRLLHTDAPAVVVRSATGYSRRFPTRDLDRLWLVTAVGARPLSAGHGFPARIVAPGRRGFWWVKWVVAIEPSPRPWWIQLPFPAT